MISPENFVELEQIQDIFQLNEDVEIKATKARQVQKRIQTKDELRKFLREELQLSPVPSDGREAKSYVPVAANASSIPIMENQLILRHNVQDEIIAKPTISLRLYKHIRPNAESVEQIYGFRFAGKLPLTQFEEGGKYLRSIECTSDSVKPGLVIIHDYFEHPLELFGICRRLATNFDVFVPFLQDIYRIGESISYQAPSENFVGYLLAYCRDVVPGSFVIIAHGAACYLAEHALNTLPACRRAWMCNNISQIRGNADPVPFLNQMEPKMFPPDASYVTDTSCAEVGSQQSTTLRTSVIFHSDSEISEISLTQYEPEAARYEVRQLEENEQRKITPLKRVSSQGERSEAQNAISMLRHADEVCREIIDDRFCKMNNSKISEIEGYRKKHEADVFRPLAHYYNRLPRLLFLCPAKYQQKFELLPLDKEFAIFASKYLIEALKADVLVTQSKTVVCLFSDHPALPIVPIEGYQSHMLLCTSFDLFGCCEVLFGRFVI